MNVNQPDFSPATGKVTGLFHWSRTVPTLGWRPPIVDVFWGWSFPRAASLNSFVGPVGLGGAFFLSAGACGTEASGALMAGALDHAFIVAVLAA